MTFVTTDGHNFHTSVIKLHLLCIVEHNHVLKLKNAWVKTECCVTQQAIYNILSLETSTGIVGKYSALLIPEEN
jgi:hypothetical protein